MKKRMCCMLCSLFLLSFLTSSAEDISADPSTIERIVDSVFMLTTYKNGEPLGTGSAFLLFNNRTLITNYHVIESADSVVAESDDGDEYYISKILVASERWDIAILQLSAPTVLEPLPYSEDNLMRGMSLIVIGSPKGFKNTVSTGIISSLYIDDDIRWIQFTAPVSPGSSGGPVLNNYGQVVGMTTWNRTDAQNLNFGLGISNIIELYQTWDGQSTWSIRDHNKAIPEGHAMTSDASGLVSVTKKPYSVHFTGFDREGLYTGETLDGVPHGYGVFTAVNSEGLPWHYIGEWQYGHMEGEGAQYWDNGQATIGLFSNNNIFAGTILYTTNTYIRWFNEFDHDGNQYFEFYENAQPSLKGYADTIQHKLVNIYTYKDGQWEALQPLYYNYMKEQKIRFFN